MGVVDDVAKIPSRSLRSDISNVDNSAAGGRCLSTVCFVDRLRLSVFATRSSVKSSRGAGLVDGLPIGRAGRFEGGFLVASADALAGRDSHAASRSCEWLEQNRMYRSTTVS